jgi:hypothetical protein
MFCTNESDSLLLCHFHHAGVRLLPSNKNDQAHIHHFSRSDRIREMGFGAGMGLPNIKRNADKLDIETVIGKGTTLTIEVNIND